VSGAFERFLVIGIRNDVRSLRNHKEFFKGTTLDYQVGDVI
jgi:hypothetical protein